MALKSAFKGVCLKLSAYICKFINLSSAAVYGNPASLPINESQILDPFSPYGVHKDMAEQIFKEFYSYWNIRQFVFVYFRLMVQDYVNSYCGI